MVASYFCFMQWSVLLPVVLTLVANQDTAEGGFLGTIGNFCYTKWAMEAFVITNAERFDMTTLSSYGVNSRV